MNDASKSTIKQVPETERFSHPELTTGKPYQLYVSVLNKAMIYGTHENSPTLASFITLLNVNLKNNVRSRNKVLGNTIYCVSGPFSSRCI